jgi:hypothetical protein
MKKLLLIIVFIFSVPIAAQVKTLIDECKSDIFFANGILTAKKEAERHKYRVYKNIQDTIYNGDEIEMLNHHGFKLAYNFSFKEKFGEAAGAVLDIMESYEQLQNTSTGWYVFNPVMEYGVERYL